MAPALQPPTMLQGVARELRGAADVFSPSWAKALRAPRGDGHAVVVAPGYMTSDRSTQLLRNYLLRLGYDARGWGLGRNRGQMRRLVRGVMDLVEEQSDRTGAKVSLLGWSLGGIVVREAARELPQRVRRVITMGSPIQGGPKYTLFAKTTARQGVDLDAAAELAANRHRDNPLRVPVTSIYSKRDGVVAWGASVDPWTDGVELVEVRSSHLAMGANPRVFRLVADRLAQLGG